MRIAPKAETDRPVKSTGAPRGGRYRAPDEWRTVPFAELLAGSARSVLEPKQMDLLAKVARGGVDEKGGLLFVAGNTELLEKRCIAIIGARNATPAGRQRARQLARQLASHDVVVISGLADGIDTEALTAAMDAGGKVIAVIGTPIDQAYPAKNKTLQEAIYRDHLLVSQFPSGSRVFPSNFPARNRTMAALSDASVVMEASDSSGTLHQAAECQRLGRWLGIAKSVMDDPSLTWPGKFAAYPRCVELTSTDQLLKAVYG